MDQDEPMNTGSVNDTQFSNNELLERLRRLASFRHALAGDVTMPNPQPAPKRTNDTNPPAMLDTYWSETVLNEDARAFLGLIDGDNWPGAYAAGGYRRLLPHEIPYATPGDIARFFTFIERGQRFSGDYAGTGWIEGGDMLAIAQRAHELAIELQHEMDAS